MGLFESLGAGVKAVATSLAPAGNTPFSNWGGQGAYVSGGTGYGPGGAGGGSSPGSRNDDFKDIGDIASNGIVSTCVSAIAEAFVSAPPMLEQFDGKKWQPVDSHPLLDLLRNPNPFYGADHLWTATLAAEITTGNAFWRVVWNRARTQPVELWWEPHMWPNYDARVFIRDYTMRVDGKPHRIGAAANYDPRNAERIDHAIHFRYQIDRKNPRWGWTPLFAVLREIAGDNVAATYQTAVLKNGATASIFFSIKDGLGQSMTAGQMEELVAGVERRLRREGAGRVAGTNLPVDLHKVGFSPEELALDRLPASYERRVCSNLKVPPMVVGLGAGDDSKTYANYGEAIDDFWQRTIIPVEERKGSELEAQLFRLFGMDRSEYRIVWDRSQIQALQEDETALFTRLEGASGGPFLTPNEARERAKLPMIEGGETLRLVAQPVTEDASTDEIKMVDDKGLHHSEDDGKFVSFWGGKGRDKTTAEHFNGEVEMQVSDPEKVEGLSKALFGKNLSQNAWAHLSGAPDGSQVIVAPSKTVPGGIDIGIAHPQHLLAIGDNGEGATQTLHIGNSNGSVSLYGLMATTGQVKGIGARMMLFTIEKARALKLDSVYLNAAGEAGKAGWSGWKVWPRLGFTAPLDYAEIKALPKNLKGAKDVADLMSTAEGRKHWETVGVGRYMTFDLDPKSYLGQKCEAVRRDYTEREGINLR